MPATREVREDQHGTITGYVYGCRCNPCRIAHRDYYRGRGQRLASPESIERVYEALEREADFDGLATATGERLGELAGITREAAHWSLRQLCEAGRVRVVGRTGRGGVLEIQLEEF